MSKYAQRFQANIYDNKNHNETEDNDSDDDDDDEESLFERKALIAGSSSQDNSGSRIRLRQSINKNNTISNGGVSLDTFPGGQHELRPIRHGASPLLSEEFTYYDIQPGDTLQSICLRFASSMDQIKRLNSMMTDQEFYGLRRLKLPVGKLGLLRDALESASSSHHHHNNDNSDLSSTTGQPFSPSRVHRANLVNSPGGALSVGPSTSQYATKFKQSVSPSYSSDRLNNISDIQQTTSTNYLPASSQLVDHNHELAATTRFGNQHSQSFSSLQDFQVLETNTGQQQSSFANKQSANRKLAIVESKLVGENFIRSELHRDGLIDADDLQAACRENVVKVFEDLDYHVSRAKEAAQNYDERATQLVAGINNVGGGDGYGDGDNFRNLGLRFKSSRVSLLPQLFVCNENFGLNLRKLVAFILIVCLFIPLIYILQRQTHYFDFLLMPPAHNGSVKSTTTDANGNHHFHNTK